MKYKVTIEYAAFFEIEIDAEDEDQAEDVAFDQFERNLAHPYARYFYMKDTESEVIDVKEIKE